MTCRATPVVKKLRMRAGFIVKLQHATHFQNHAEATVMVASAAAGN